MKLTLAGYETKSQKQFHQELTSYSAQVARGDVDGMPPTAATPVFADENGHHFVGMPTDDGLVTLPFIPGSPARGSDGGFVAVDSLAPTRSDTNASLLSGVGSAIDPGSAASWLGTAAANSALNGAPGTPLAGALAMLGLPNPMAAGVVGGAVAAASNMMGFGRAGSLLGGAMGGGPEGLANALGSQALSGLLGRTPLGGIPGMGALAGLAGGQLSNLANLLTGGGWSAGLDQASGMLGNLLGGGGGLDPGAMMDNIVAGGCTDVPGMDPSGGLPSLESIGAQALDQAASMLLDQWQVDDESSAAEHIANKLVKDNQAILKEAAQDPQGLLDRITGLFVGVSSAANLPAARLKDPDVTKPEIVAQGVATILAEGQPISRITDPLAPSKAMILEGAATVLSAGLPTARVTSKTDSPGIAIELGAPTVLVGGPSQFIDPPSKPPKAETPSNDGPSAPKSPEKPASSSSDGENTGTEEQTSAGAGQDSNAETGNGTDAKPDSGAGGGEPTNDDTTQPDDQQTSPETPVTEPQTTPPSGGSIADPNTETTAPAQQDYECQSFSQTAALGVGGTEGVMFCKGPDGQVHRYHFTDVNLTKASAQSSFNWSTGVVSMTDPKALDSTIAACGGGSGAIFVGANAQYCYAAGNPNVNVGNSGGFSFGLGAGGGPSATRFEYQGSYAHFLDAVRKKDRID